MVQPVTLPRLWQIAVRPAAPSRPVSREEPGSRTLLVPAASVRPFLTGADVLDAGPVPTGIDAYQSQERVYQAWQEAAGAKPTRAAVRGYPEPAPRLDMRL